MNLLTHTNEAEGKIGIGTLPPDLHPIIDDIYNEYYTTIPDKNVTTYHTWYHTLSPTLKEKLGKIQTHPFWNKLCNNQQTCIKINVKEMDELYYSNFTKTVEFNSIYNSCIIFDGHNYHSADHYYDNKCNENRLTLITFFKSLSGKGLKYSGSELNRI